MKSSDNIDKILHADILTIRPSVGIDALLNPFALLLCFYSLAMFTRFVGGAEKNEGNIDANDIPMQTGNGEYFIIDFLYFKLFAFA